MNDNELELISGDISAVVYQNPENGYAVIKLNTQGATVTVVGTIPMAAIGEQLVVTGKWVNHASYGRQFEAEFLERMMPQTRVQVLAYLSSRAIRGIGPATAEKIVNRFGTDALRIIEESPEELAEIPGISNTKAMAIGQYFAMMTGVRRLVEVLSVYHIPAEISVQLYRSFGERAMELLQENPYLLTEPAFGADFALVDAFALERGISGDDPRRVEAGFLFELSYNLSNGHVFLPEEKLIAATSALLELSEALIIQADERLLSHKRIVRDTVAGMSVIYLPEYHEAEIYLTSRFLQMAKATSPAPAHLENILLAIEDKLSITYAEQQREALRCAACNQLMILTGGPGTGKSTSLAGMLELFDRMKLKTCLAAPTGRAAKRLSELTGRDASTIHRLLEVQMSSDGSMCFSHDEADPLRCDCLIVDETSMVDLLLMDALVRALKPSCRLVLVGDPDQLPPVGAGNVFSDLIRSGTIATVRLSQIFRQAQESLIVMNAHAVNHGQLPELRARDNDFFFLRRTDPAQALSLITELCSTRLPKNMGIDPGDIQVLSPTRKGMTGTASLNNALQAVLNPASPSKKERQCGDYIFREGDRVMQIRNNYDILWKRLDGLGAGSGIFNGDIGRIVTIDTQDENVRIVFDDRVADYTFDMLSELEPAFAMTVHKSQGNEYRAVVLCCMGSSPYLLTRSILYTALTRARELLIIVGSEEIISAMVENDRRQKRYSGLKLRLQNR
ncbi:MAG: ATP-dependent RecD-like DNA helicase [Clostridia bacterium]|nr:ATP-dependent RecD-like DNA helicase [Clostridia bacterium]